MAKRETDYIRRVKGNPKLFKFSIGSIGTARIVEHKEFDTVLEATIWFEDYKIMLKRELKERDRGN